MNPPLTRQNAKQNLWATITPPRILKIENRKCDNCSQVKSSEFNYKQDTKIKTVYACSLTCFDELQKGKK